MYSVHHVRIMHRCHVRALCDACVGLVVNGGRCVLNGCVCPGMACGVACLHAINQGESLAQATTHVLQRSDYNRSIRATHLKEHIIVCLACGLVHCNLQAVQSVAVARNPLNATTCVCTCGEVIRSYVDSCYSIIAANEAFRDIEQDAAIFIITCNLIHLSYSSPRISVGVADDCITIAHVAIDGDVGRAIEVGITHKVAVKGDVPSRHQLGCRVHLHVRQRFCNRSDCHAHSIVRVAQSGEYAVEVDIIQLIRIGDGLAVDVAPYCRCWSPIYPILGVAVVESIVARIGSKNLRLVGQVRCGC